MTTFDYLMPFLKYAGFNTNHLRVNSENHLEQLFISLVEEDDENDTSLFVQLFFANDILKSEIGAKDNFNMLQFYIPLTMDITEEKMTGAYSLLLKFNDIVPIGVFGVNGNKVYFKYCLVTKERNPDEEMILEIIQMISYFVKSFSSKLNDFINGTKTREQIITELVNRL